MTITAEDIYAATPYARTLGMKFSDLTGPDVRARLDFHACLSTLSGGLHGGALMGLADVTAAVCAVLNSAAGGAPATTTSATQFLQPVTTDAHAHAVALHVSRSGGGGEHQRRQRTAVRPRDPDRYGAASPPC